MSLLNTDICLNMYCQRRSITCIPVHTTDGDETLIATTVSGFTWFTGNNNIILVIVHSIYSRYFREKSIEFFDHYLLNNEHYFNNTILNK